MKKFKTNKLRLSAGISLAVSLLCCLTLGFTGIFGGFAKTASATTLTNDIFEDKTEKFSASALLQFLNTIAGTDYQVATNLSAALDNVSNRISNTSNNSAKGNNYTTEKWTEQVTGNGLRNKNGNQDIAVTFGGLKWNVTYLSKTRNGDPIATLWLADSTVTSTWSSGWDTTSNANVDVAPHLMTLKSSVYGTSYIRSVALNNATPYSKLKSGQPTTGISSDNSVYLYAGQSDEVSVDPIDKSTWNLTQDENNAFAKFTMEGIKGSLTDYIEKPANVAWQEYENQTVFGGTMTWGNESYGNPDGTRAYYDHGWNNSGDEEYYDSNYPEKTNYSDWKNDYIWLPSYTEVNSGSLWITSGAQLVSSSVAWLRTGMTSQGVTVASVEANGTISTARWPRLSASVRPALHLNLRKAVENCADDGSDLYNGLTGNLSDLALADLYSQISGKQNATVNDVKNLLTADNNYQYSASDIRTDNTVTEGKDIYVYFGGLRWTVTYVSKSKTGNLVATLWLESSTINGELCKPQFNTWTTTNINYTNANVPSIYGHSLLRSYLNGTQYPTNNSGGVSTEAQSAAAQNPYWKSFIETYGDFIIEPLYMGWQETENMHTYLPSEWTMVNDAWGEPTGELNWYTGTSTISATQQLYYHAWAIDKLWIPSVCEVGLADPSISMWKLSVSQRQNGTSTDNNTSHNYNTWTRTGRAGDAGKSMIIYADGTNYYHTQPSNAYYSARPCIHLNISGENTDLLDTEKKVANDFSVGALVENLTSAASNKATITSSYNDLNNLLNSTASGVLSAADIRANNSNSNINVKFGGMDWDLTYLSRTRTGDIIATLWLDNMSERVTWSNPAATFTTTTASKYPMHMYSSSYVRSYLNGTQYTTDGTNLSTVEQGKAAQSVKWKQFIYDYGSFLATPSQVVWQETQSSPQYNIYGNNMNSPNDAYGVPVSGEFASGYDFLVANPKQGYSDWQNDKLWLPSYIEAGYPSKNAVGMWGTTQAQRINTKPSWVRTAYSGAANGVNSYNARGVNDGVNPVTNTNIAAARPAIHLNLARIKDFMTPTIADGAEDLTYNKQPQEVINSIHPDLSRVSYEVQFTGFDGASKLYYANTSGNNLEDGEITVENGTMFAKRAGKYTVTFTLRQAATTSGSSNYTINTDENGWPTGDVWAGIDDDIKTGLNERVETVVICFEIKPVVLTVEWSGDLTATYDGQPHTVTATPDGVLGGESVALTIGYGNGIITPVNAGEYTATATLVNGNYILKYTDADGFEAYGYSVTCPIKIEKATVEAVWTTATEFIYNGGEQGAELTALTGLCDDDATNAALLLAAQGAAAYDKTPVHVGNYVASLSLEGLTGFDNYELSETNAEFKFKITPAEVTASYISEDGTFTREFDGKKLVVNADGFETLATDDDAATIFVIKYRLATAADVEENWSETAPVFGEYVAKAFDIADGDYTVTNSQTVTISKRQINIIWSGDDNSVIATYNGNQLLTWLYDGAVHTPKAAVDKDDLDGVIDLNGNAVEDLKLQITSTERLQAGSFTATVGLAADDFNKYFTLAGTGCDYRISPLTITEIKWYEHGGEKTLEDGALFQKIEVFGAYGPEVEAYGAGTLSGKDAEGNAKTVKSEIKLSVGYNATFTNEYWTVGNYTATASANAGSGNAAFAQGLDTVLDFIVTEQKIEVKEVTVVWGLTVNGAFVELTDDLVVPFSGYAPKLVAKADSATGDSLPVNAGSLVAKVGKHTAYIDLKDSSTVVYKNFECPYEITPLKVKLSWTAAEWFYTGSAITPKATVDVTYTPDGMDADEYADVLQGIADLGLNVITVTGATDAGNRTAVAKMSENFEIVDGSENFEFTILKYRLDISKVVWSSEDENSVKYDEDMNMYFSWANNGKLHAPNAALTVTIGGENKQIKLIVNGATSATGTHYATALLDSSVAANNNFILGRFETVDGETTFIPCGAECKFVIVQFEVGDVYWVTGANEGADLSLNGEDKLTFTYNGRAQCPRAYYLDGEEKVWLNVWGEMTDAGEYVAHVSENFAFKNDGANKCAFVILPQELEVRWQYDADESPITYNGKAQAPTVKLFDGDGKEITALADGNGYSILKFTEAGEHVAEISFTNGNYTYKAGTNEKAFTIKKYKINVTFTSSNDQGYEMTNVWTYKATVQGPAVRDVTVYLVEGGAGITFGESSEHRIIVTGRESDVGVYTAVATLDGSVADNANFELVNAKREYEIAAHKIVINWKDTGSEGNFIWTYTGNTVCPTATYQDWNKETKTATVMGGNSSAGTYTASVVLPANCEFMYEDGHQYSGTHTFTVKRAAVTEIVWYTDDTYEHEIEGGVASYVFDGGMHLPAAKIKSTGAELIVTGARRNAGEGYVATAALSDAGNYVLDAANANKTIKFNITPMSVLIKWIGNEDAESADDEFVWTYTGSFICPTAVLTYRDEDDKEVIVTENGRVVYVTVSGGAVSAGNEYFAVAVDNLANYDFATARHKFEIKAKELEGFEWNALGADVDDSEVAGGGYYKYTYTYNGKTQRPLLTLENNAAGVKFGYRINKYDGTDIGDIAETVNAGLYLVTVYATDGNYALPEGADTVVVEIEQRTAIVQWSALSADGETKAPEAWYYDADNQAVKLEVTVEADGDTAGKFIASVSPADGNYNFTGEKSKDFTMAVSTSGDVTWDFENDEWKAVPAEPVTPPSGGETGGEGGETGEGGEGGDETGSETGEGGETGEGSEGNGGETDGETTGGEGSEGDGTEATALTAETSVENVENRAIAADNQQLIAEDKKSLSNLLDEE